MNVGSLFSGVGGFDLGLERAGMRIASEEVEAMSGDQQVAAIQHWLPVLGGYRMENDE